MPRIYVEFSGLDQIGNSCKNVSSKVSGIQSDLQHTVSQLDWDVRYESDINNTAKQIGRKLEKYSSALAAYKSFIDEARSEYAKLDEYKKVNTSDLIKPGPKINPALFKPLGPNGTLNFNLNNILKDILITKPHIHPGVLPFVSNITNLLAITSGIYSGKTPSFFDYSRTPSASAAANWLGYELKDGNPGITAWLGKANAEAQNEWGYARVNAFLGKAEAEAKSEFAFMKKENGKRGEEDTTTFLVAEAEAGASVTAVAGDAEAGLGSDMLGVEGKAEGKVGDATAKAGAEFSVGSEGVNAYAKGEAMASAVEGKAEGTINILGLEITGKVGGYAGAVGVEGKIGVEDNKFVLEGGAAALLGGSVGVEVGFNDEGWENFVDFIVFWD